MMYTIGITGGIGAGKSEVLAYLEKRWGAFVLRLDDVSRDLLVPGTEEYRKTVELFGEEILFPDGQPDRKKIAGLIFNDEPLRAGLDAIIHPGVRRETMRIMEERKKLGTKLFVMEAALLIEDHYDAICNELWYIYAGITTRYSRLVSSRHYSPERIRDTMARQLSEREFREHTDFTVDNDGSFDDAARMIDGRIEEILKGI